jgi:hypothetical protein
MSHLWSHQNQQIATKPITSSVAAENVTENGKLCLNFINSTVVRFRALAIRAVHKASKAPSLT